MLSAAVAALALLAPPPATAAEGLPTAAAQAAIVAQERSFDGIVEAVWKLADGELAEVELRMGWAGGASTEGYLVAIHDLTDRVRRMGERWRRTFDAMVDGVALVDDEGVIVLANQALQPNQSALTGDLAERLRGDAPRQWRIDEICV